MKTILVLLCLLLTPFCCIQSENILFHRLSIDNGLSHNSGMAFYQDERGFIWIGTRNGLNLYNGRSIRVFKYDKDKPENLSNNLITQITGDGNGNIYIQTGQGMIQYNIASDRFTRLTTSPINALYFNRQLYYAQGSTIFRYQNEKSEAIYKLTGRADGQNINCLLQKGDSVLAGTSNGLYLLQKNKESTCLIPDISPWCLYLDSKERIWISSYDGKGLFMLHDGKIRHFAHSSAPGSLSCNQTHHICEDLKGRIWISTFQGLNMYDPATDRFTAYYQEANGLSESSVWGLMCDRQGIVWAGTYYGGVHYFQPTTQIYKRYYAGTNETEGLSSSIVGNMTADNLGRLWLCTEGGGICRYNPANDRFRWYRHEGDNVNNLSHNHAKCLYYDPEKEILWIGTHLGGLNRLDLKTERFTHYRHREGDDTSLSSDIIMAIVPFGNKLLLGANGPLILFDPSTGKSKNFFSNIHEQQLTSYAYHLCLTQNGDLWIISSTGRRLLKYDTQRHLLTEYKQNHNNPQSIDGQQFTSIYEDSSQRIWIGTDGNGLNLYHPETDCFENLDVRKNGLGSNVVYEVRELPGSRMLITTDAGFSIWNETQRTFTNYERGTDFPLHSVNENSLFYSSKTRNVYIGGLDGMVSFNERTLDNHPDSYNLLPYQLTVNGAGVSPNDGTDILNSDISTVDRIVLHPGQDIFTLEYTTTNYLPTKHDRLIYRLEGYSNNWMPLPPTGNITYTSLPSGNYTLVVKAENCNGTELAVHRLQIKVIPPFYLSWWAYTCYIIGAIFLFYLLQKAHNNRIRLSEQMIYEKKHAEDVEQLTQNKLRFFTNISHEFRTPLTLIMGQMEILMEREKGTSSLYIALRRVYRNCQQLNGLISELLDFRKQEQGFMTIQAREQDVVEFLHTQYHYFEEYAKQKNITFTFKKSQEQINLWFDRKQMQKVMNNLLSNAFKYVSHKGHIVLSVRKKGDEAIIEVTNTGTGIRQEDLCRIFDRFYQTDEGMHSTGTGIGLHLSKGIVLLHHGRIEATSSPNEETTFTIYLPLGNSLFKAEELVQSTESQEENEDRNEQTVKMLLNEAPPYGHKIKQKETGTSEEFSKYKMLIVEDHDSLREMLVELFSPFYNLLTAADGNEGWEKVQTELPDIVLSDVVMPQKDGIELCRLIKVTPETCHIPVILLTARTEQAQMLEGLDIGADDYIEKPFDVKILVSRCANLVKTHQQIIKRLSIAIPTPQDNKQKPANSILSQDFINKATEIIHQHIDNPDFSVQILADNLFISRTQLFNKCKKATGTAPLEFILNIRLEEAASLFDNHPELNVNEVCDRTGFTSVKLFRQHFKDKYQMTPSEYRKRTKL